MTTERSGGRRPLVSLSELQTKPPSGLRCPECGCGHFFTTKTDDRQGGYRYRRKECRNCGHRVTTTERIIG